MFLLFIILQTYEDFKIFPTFIRLSNYMNQFYYNQD